MFKAYTVELTQVCLGFYKRLLNTRKLTLERQFFLDDFDSLSAEAQRQVTDLIAGLKQRHQAASSKEM
jgi:hypothetical protein